MIDLHIHILPGVDDGPEEMEDAVEMARAAAKSGVRAIAATSHASPGAGGLEEGFERYRRSFMALKRELQAREIPLKLYPGMEVLAGHGLIPALKKGTVLTLNHSRYVLLEFFFDIEPETIDRVLKDLLREGYRPVLAHPERYRCIRHAPWLLYDWDQDGVVIQVNKGSILGEFGYRVEKTARWILEKQLAGIVASDAHDTYDRTAHMEEVREVLEDTCGIRGAELLLKENPRRILADKDVI